MQTKKKKSEPLFDSLVSLSGGLDSTVLLARMIKTFKEFPVSVFDPKKILAVTFCYESKHNPYELAAASRVAHHFGVEHSIVNVCSMLDPAKASSLLSPDVKIPEGHYQEESMRSTVVPGRNLFFASVLASMAESYGARSIYMGVHSGDHFIYPDCRPEFFWNLYSTILASTDGRVRIMAPLIDMNKISVLQSGLALQAPLHLTRTCYTDQEIACGKCGSCQERLEAFAHFSLPDPIKYHSRELLPKRRPPVDMDETTVWE